MEPIHPCYSDASQCCGETGGAGLHSGWETGLGMVCVLGGVGMGMRKETASLMRTSEKAGWRRWHLETSLDEEAFIKAVSHLS